jgi:hypothetical protein
MKDKYQKIAQDAADLAVKTAKEKLLEFSWPENRRYEITCDVKVKPETIK